MGKKSCKSGSKSSGGGGNKSSQPPILKSAIDAVASFLKLSDEHNAPIENYFPTHVHSVSSCDGDGAFNITSLFIIDRKVMPPSAPEMGVITVCCIRCHDNIRNTLFLPLDAFQEESIRVLTFGTDIGGGKTALEYYHAYVEYQQNFSGLGYRRT